MPVVGHRPSTLGEAATPVPPSADAPPERAATEAAIKAHDRLAEEAGIDPDVGRTVTEEEARALGFWSGQEKR